MGTLIPGLILVLIGAFLGIITYKKYKLFWEFLSTRLLRRWVGDTVTTISLYIVSVVLIVAGLLLSVGIIA